MCFCKCSSCIQFFFLTPFFKNNTHLAILCDLFGVVKWPFKWLSDLQLRYKKGYGLNHLAPNFCHGIGLSAIGGSSRNRGKVPLVPSVISLPHLWRRKRSALESKDHFFVERTGKSPGNAQKFCLFLFLCFFCDCFNVMFVTFLLILQVLWYSSSPWKKNIWGIFFPTTLSKSKKKVRLTYNIGKLVQHPDRCIFLWGESNWASGGVNFNSKGGLS